MSRFGFDWPESLNCEKFPNLEESLCIGEKTNNEQEYSVKRPAETYGYMITTPRRWIENETTQICATLTNGDVFGADDALQAEITVFSYNASQDLGQQTLRFTPGESNECVDLAVPGTELKPHIRAYKAATTLSLTGNLGKNVISEKLNVSTSKGSDSTFVQTDKYLYKPGQTVKFRILSVIGPYLNVSTEAIKEVFVQTPSRTRIQQWKNVQNTNGLVHLEFQLSDEVEEGSYQIVINAQGGTNRRSFKVEDYVLPKYEVTIEPATTIYGDNKTVIITMCAKYTYGEDVKGNATLSIAVGSYRIYANESQTKPISGCANFTFETSKLRFDDNNCHIRIKKLRGRGVVVEEGTGVEISGANENMAIKRKVVSFKDLSPTEINKPYMPKFVKILANYADGSRAKREVMKVCGNYLSEHVCKNFTTSNFGYLSFTLPADFTSRLTVKALAYPELERNWNPVMEQSSFHKYLYNSNSYITRSNSSLTINHRKELECLNGNPVQAKIQVVFFVKNVTSAEVVSQVLSRGQVQFTNKTRIDFTSGPLPWDDSDVFIESRAVPQDVRRGTFDVYLNLPATVSPKIKLLIWFTTPEGNVVADERELDVTDCLPHQVNMTWSVPKAEPGSQAELSVTGAKNAFCSIGVVDKSVELLSKQNNQNLKISNILSNLNSFKVSHWDGDQLQLEYCLQKYNGNLTEANLHLSNISETERLEYGGYRIIAPHDYYRRDSSRLEALHMFVRAGYLILTDQILQREFCYDLIIDAIKEEERRKEEKNKFDDRIKESVFEDASSFSGGGGGGGGFGASPPRPQIVGNNIRPQAQSFAGGLSSPSSTPEPQEQERAYLPETWLWDLVTLSEIGESKEAVTLPDAITQWVGRAVCVHPSEGVGFSDASSVTTFTHFFTDLTLPASITRGEILPLKVSVFNYLDEDLPVKLTLKPSTGYETVTGEQSVRDICVPAKDKVVETIKMSFIELDDVNITVEAVVDPNSSLNCGSGTPPIAKLDRFIRALQVESEGITRQQTFTKLICAEDVTDNTVAAESWTIAAPPGSVKDSDRAWITATGDILGPSIENIGRIVDLPTGCGEQNMINFAPNIYIREYLEASNQLTSVNQEKIDYYLRRGYQRQLRYKHRDGSFSSFGSRDASGSTWLTAFVLKSLQQATNYTFIDEKVLKEGAQFLHNQQNNVTGCYNSKGRVVHKMLQGGFDKTNNNAEVLLSAYVLGTIGPLQKYITQKNTTDPAEPLALAISCVEKDDSIHPYSLALRAYALSKVEAASASTVIDQLLTSAVVTDSEMSWDLPDAGKNRALQVETAAYVLLALLNHDQKAYVEQSRKIVRWISGYRNSRGGFISTQDTVVALEALAAFQKTQPTTSRDVTTRVKSGDFEHSFNVLESNKLVQQRIDLPSVPTNVSIFVEGTGCVMAQGVLRYNVLADSPTDAFTLAVKTEEIGSDCRSRRLSGCTTYTLSDLVSNMAIMEFKLQTGYIVSKSHLQEILDNDQSGQLKRFEVDGSRVLFYLEEITFSEVCVDFEVYQDILIENLKPGYVKIYDYYQPEYETSKEYSFPDPVLCNSIR